MTSRKAFGARVHQYLARLDSGESIGDLQPHLVGDPSLPGWWNDLADLIKARTPSGWVSRPEGFLSFAKQ